MREMGGAGVGERREEIVDRRVVVGIRSEDTGGEDAQFVLERPFGRGELVGEDGPEGVVVAATAGRSSGLWFGESGCDVEGVGGLEGAEERRVFRDLGV